MTRPMSNRTILIVGNSDGIGLALTRRLLERGYRVLGVSRRESPVAHGAYRHVVSDVTHTDYATKLDALLKDEPILYAAYYCAAIGERTNVEELAPDLHVFDVNLMGAVRTAQRLLPLFFARGDGRFIVLSSQADVIVNPEAASYTASKAAVSAYFEGLGLKLRKSKVRICNVRFGFVDTKLARAGIKPFLIKSERAALRLERLLDGPVPLRLTYPKRTRLLVAIAALVQRLRVAVA